MLKVVDIQSNNMLIIHDFNFDLAHFKLPDNLKSKIEDIGYSIIDSNDANNIDKKNCSVFFGNRIKTKDLSIYPNLKYIHLGCVGYNNLDLNFLKKQNIHLTNSSNIVESAMAEMVITAILWFEKRLNEIDYNKKISRDYFNIFYKHLNPLSKMKILIYGYGLVGKKVAKLLESFTKNISIVTRNNNESNCKYKFFKSSEEYEKVHTYDYVINCLPLNESSSNLFDKGYFNLMNSQSVYINVGRPGTNVINDLINAVKSKKIRATYLDVYEKEDLLKLDPENNNRILVTPHISGWNNNYWVDQSKLTLFNLNEFKNENVKKLKNKIL